MGDVNNKQSHDVVSGAEERTLPRSIFVPQEDPRGYLRETIDSIFSDKLMAFLALLLVPIILLEFLVSLTTQEYDFLEIIDWTIIAVFIMEYTTKLYLAKSRWAHFKSPWHLLDLVIVTVPFVQFLPFFALKQTGSASLLLRLLRLPRVFAAAGRATTGRGSGQEAVAVPQVEEVTSIRKVTSASFSPNDSAKTVDLTWDDLAKELSKDEQAWFDIYNISDNGFRKLSKILEVAEPQFKSSMIDEIYPHIDYLRAQSFIFLQSGKLRYPETASHHLTISRSGFIIICYGSKLISVSRHDIDLLDKVIAENPIQVEVGTSFLISVLYAVLDNLLSQYRSLLSEIELDVIQIADIPRSKLPRDFLDRIYQITKEVSRLDSNLVHLKDLLGIIISKEVPLAGYGKESEEAFQLLESRASYEKELSSGLIESIKSIIELYMNQESFETNRMLKILAVITSVAIIPAAVSGLLGMNLIDVPYHGYLWEVILMIGIAVVFAIYSFIKLGWLKP